ncbi:MAG: DUF5813 family protein [Halodesulfurarchaeum sp.]
MSESYLAAFRRQSRFRDEEPMTDEDGAVYNIEGLHFEGWTRVRPDGVVLVSSLPTLDATVTGETVAEVVQEGWFETLGRRLEDAPSVIDRDVGEPMVTREGTRVRVETPISSDPDHAPDDVIAIANYVEGTWVQGIIPGYEYNEQVRSIRERARDRANDATGGSRDGGNDAGRTQDEKKEEDD